LAKVTIWAIESDNDKDVIKELAGKLAAYLEIKIEIRVVGKNAFNDVTKKVKREPTALERAVASYLVDSNCVIFITDSDSNNRLQSRRKNQNSAISQIERVTNKFAGKAHLALAVHELEAWLLIDCLGVCCYFAGVENSLKFRARQQVKFKSLLKNVPGNTELIVEAEAGGKGPKEYLINFSEKILKALDPKIKPRPLNQKKYRESLSAKLAEYIEINDETLKRNKSLQTFGRYLAQCGTEV
jgi:hypothetical protein